MSREPNPVQPKPNQYKPIKTLNGRGPPPPFPRGVFRFANFTYYEFIMKKIRERAFIDILKNMNNYSIHLIIWKIVFYARRPIFSMFRIMLLKAREAVT